MDGDGEGEDERRGGTLATPSPEEDEEESVLPATDFGGVRPSSKQQQQPTSVDVDGSDKSDEDDGDLEFSFVVEDSDAAPDVTADEIFSNGFIRPIYPVFDRALLFSPSTGPAPASRGTLGRLLIEEREAELSHELEGIPPGSYCVWAPRSVAKSPGSSHCRKSRSAGSSSLRWRIRDLVVGRSHSDRKERFVFLAKRKEKGNPDPVEAEKEGAKVTDVDMVTAHRIYFRKDGDAGSRKCVLPNRQELLAFFANMNSITKTHHPF
ncbi:uncharacterized protein LOC122044149 [Zingiber officinale]|uniref:Uncharacterized protein n=1 Tax=Zingiber officinale TaxID=94328 RepID=A0A8J5HNX7_ZINOF|nr:uncharacterized protein LOC122044149 [Zingiber officinale]KAG6529874.1 hypothetical protein ZIOFF_012089 [Zingiber officinale]